MTQDQFTNSSKISIKFGLEFKQVLGVVTIGERVQLKYFSNCCGYNSKSSCIQERVQIAILRYSNLDLIYNATIALESRNLS